MKEQSVGRRTEAVKDAGRAQQQGAGADGSCPARGLVYALDPCEQLDRWSHLSRSELISLGRTIVTERLEKLGCTVTPPSSRVGGKLDVETPSGRSLEVFVSTQRLGGYVFWTKRRFTPATNRFAAIVLLTEAEDPAVYLVPSTEWRRAAPPLTDRPNVGKRSEAEYGISLARSSLPALQRYAWNKASGNEHFR